MLIPHITKLVDSPSDKVKLLANWCVANMTSKGSWWAESGHIKRTTLCFWKAVLENEMRAEKGKKIGFEKKFVLVSLNDHHR